jgi:hypothetical protein
MELEVDRTREPELRLCMKLESKDARDLYAKC